MKVALFWDVDGTLLTTARAGVFSLEEALTEVTGLTVDLQELATAGLTDHEVGVLALRHAGVDPRDDVVDRFLRAHERRLPACLHRRQGRVMPGVREVLADLDGRDDVDNLLLTGNTELGAAAKLAHYGLDRYFHRSGSFCAGPGERTEIARRAVALADGATAFVIGDTPADIACGKAVGARTIAVATGSYPLDELRAHDPWRALDRIPEPPEFRSLIGVPAR